MIPNTPDPNQKKLVFGITLAQATVLAVLGVVSFIMLGAGLLVSQDDRAPATPAEPAATPIPGWKQMEGAGVVLWLPDSFTGGDAQEDLGFIRSNLEALGPEYEQLARMLEQNPDAFVIWAFDAQVGSSGFLTNVNVTFEKVPSAITIDTYIDAVTNQLPADFRVVGREMVSLDRYEAGRLTVEFSVAGRQGKQLSYMIKEGGTMWALTFSTGADEFTRRLPVFEQSARTFAVQP